MYLIAAVCGTALAPRRLERSDLVSRSLACCTHRIISLFHVLCVLLLFVIAMHHPVQDKLDPSKDDDVILALIIAAASSKHRDTARMRVLKQGTQVP